MGGGGEAQVAVGIDRRRWRGTGSGGKRWEAVGWHMLRWEEMGGGGEVL